MNCLLLQPIKCKITIINYTNMTKSLRLLTILLLLISTLTVNAQEENKKMLDLCGGHFFRLCRQLFVSYPAFLQAQPQRVDKARPCESQRQKLVQNTE